MMKSFASLTMLLILVTTVLPAFAGGAADRGAQRRSRKAVKVWNQKMADEWKKFETEMAEAEAELDKLQKRTPTTKKQTKPKSRIRLPQRGTNLS
jgi:hypothetical protein